MGARPPSPSDPDPDDAVTCAALSDPARLAALAQTGLGPTADPEMDLLAAWVRRALAVPVALVSLVEPGQQVFPGQSGLPHHLAAGRATPLSHSYCQHVIASAEPLVVADAREHPLLRDSRAIPDLGMIAYAGLPLTDADGNVLGALCAIDLEPRRWTEDELDTLRGIARACTSELRLRLATVDAGVELARRDRAEHAQARALDRSRALLHASRALAAASSEEDVCARVVELLRAELHPGQVRILLLDDPQRPGTARARRGAGAGDGAAAEPFAAVSAAAAETAVREQRIVHHGSGTVPGLRSVVAVPVAGADGPLGAIVLGWPQPDAVEPADLPTLATIAGFAGQALERARILHHRISVAHQLQDAMLTTLPVVDGLVLAARYEPADSRENVGGDWFDAAPVVHPDHPGEPVLSVSVGDVLGHNVHAATIMGQVRSMLRQSAWDHPAGPPSVVLDAFETVNLGLGLGAAGTAVLADLRRAPGGRWSMRWTNAGHPPPVLLLPDGSTELLTDHDALFGYSITSARARTDRHRELPPGATVFLYTDGLVEQRGSDIDQGIDALVALLQDLRHLTPRQMVDTAVDTLARNTDDDVVAFALHVPG